MSHYLDQFNAWWRSLESRERQTLAAGTLIATLILIYLLIVEPMMLYRENLQQRVDAQRRNISWMLAAAEIIAVQPNRAPAPGGNASLLGVIDQTARTAQLGSALKRAQQDQDGGVRVRMEAAAFDSLVIWLDTLDRNHAISPVDMTIEDRAETGLIDANITFNGMF